MTILLDIDKAVVLLFPHAYPLVFIFSPT